MNKNVFKKLFTPGGHLHVGDLLSEEKKQLYAHMAKFGATGGYSYERLFKVGFQPWELDGILKMKIDYLNYLKCHNKIDVDVRCVETVVDTTTGEEVYKHRLFYPMGDDGQEKSIDLNAKGEFWLMLGDLKKRSAFGEFMQQQGMRSFTTVAKRFGIDDWREYELVGIKSVIQQL